MFYLRISLKQSTGRLKVIKLSRNDFKWFGEGSRAGEGWKERYQVWITIHNPIMMWVTIFPHNRKYF